MIARFLTMSVLTVFAALLNAEDAPTKPALQTGLPPLTVPENMGVNIHFTDPKPGEMKQLADAGFKWVRMDFGWGGIERKKGEYDFSAYDRLMAALEPYGIRAYFILDYSNKNYDEGLSPHTDEGRAAFAKFAAEGVKHFKGKGVIWEMYNEPNIGFWKPKPSVEDYIKLALATGKAIREVAPDEIYVGPTTSEIPYPYHEACYKAGLLPLWDAVSIHPYRQRDPETSAPEFHKLRALISHFAPEGKKIPLLSGEWGYSVAWKNFSLERQGKYFPRQQLHNLYQGIPISIWYDWHDDGKDAKEAEHNFGTVLNEYHKDRDPVYDPKPSYIAAKTLANTLRGFTYNKRLELSNPEDYVLLFTKDQETRLAVWSTKAEAHTVTLPVSAGKLKAVGYLGDALPDLTATEKGLEISLTDGVQYLIPEKPNDALRIAASWQTTPVDMFTRGPERGVMFSVSLKNPTDRELKIREQGFKPSTLPVGESRGVQFSSRDLDRSEESFTSTNWIEVDGFTYKQSTQFGVSNPVRATILPLDHGELPVQVESLSNEGIRNSILTLTNTEGLPETKPAHFELKNGEYTTVLRFKVGEKLPLQYKIGVKIEEDGSGVVHLQSPAKTYTALQGFFSDPTAKLDDFFKAHADGDAKVKAEVKLTSDVPAEAPPSAGRNCFKLVSNFDAGWRFARIDFAKEEMKAIAGEPKALTLWMYGDSSNTSLRLRFVDSTGQTFQPSGPPVTWSGWKHIEYPLDGKNVGHWGGANDGVVHYPIKWDSFLLDNGGKQKISSTIYVHAPVLVQ